MSAPQKFSVLCRDDLTGAAMLADPELLQTFGGSVTVKNRQVNGLTIEGDMAPDRFTLLGLLSGIYILIDRKADLWYELEPTDFRSVDHESMDLDDDGFQDLGSGSSFEATSYDALVISKR